MQTGRVYRRVDGGEWESLFDNAPYVSAQVDGMKIYRGSKIVTFTSSWSTLFEPDDVSALIGRPYDQANDVVLVTNGDNGTQLGAIFASAAHSNGLIRLYAKSWGLENKEVTGPARVSWVFVAG